MDAQQELAAAMRACKRLRGACTCKVSPVSIEEVHARNTKNAILLCIDHSSGPLQAKQRFFVLRSVYMMDDIV